MACIDGHLRIAKWLYSLGGADGVGKVDIHAENDYAFRYSCVDGHLKVAKWLYSLGGVNMHVNNFCVVYETRENGHEEVAEWIESL
jgi:hypothetical protein